MRSLCFFLGLVAIDASREANLAPDSEGFHPIRIRIEYLDTSPVSETVRFVREVAAPHVSRLLSRVIQVRDRMQMLVIDTDKCNYPNFPAHLTGKGLRDTDLVAIIDMSTDFSEDSSTLMATQTCQYDVIGRPQAGRIQIRNSWLSGQWKMADQPVRENEIIEVLLHEFIHLLGFNSVAFAKFRRSGGPGARYPPGEVSTIMYTCELDSVTKKPIVEWDVDPTFVEGLEEFTYFHTFYPGILEAIDARGLKSSECRCPLDPGRKYTYEDIEYCIMHPNHCAIAIVTEKVVEKTREYFGCSSAKGMEIENGRDSRSCRLVLNDMHWKKRLVLGELMNYETHIRFNFLSPMTLALLEDSGWYKVDYSVIPDPPVPGITWGHLKGCPFLFDKCVESTGAVLDPDAFCSLENGYEMKCSKNALTILQCTGAQIFESDSAPPDQLIQYQYLAREKIFFRNHAHFDHCPVFSDASIYSCLDNDSQLPGISSPDSRCFMNTGGIALCLRAKCSPDGKSYIVQTVSGEKISCTKAGGYMGSEGIVCQDPKIICSDVNGFHSLPGTITVPNADIK